MLLTSWELRWLPLACCITPDGAFQILEQSAPLSNCPLPYPWLSGAHATAEHNTVSLRWHAGAGGVQSTGAWVYICKTFQMRVKLLSLNLVISSASKSLTSLLLYFSLHISSINFQEFQSDTITALHKFTNFLDHLSWWWDEVSAFDRPLFPGSTGNRITREPQHRTLGEE